MRYYRWIAVFVASTLLGLGGCSKQSDLVATVGDQVITSEEFESGFGRQPQSFSSYENELDQRRLFLTNLVDQKLLVIGAYRQGFDQNDEIRRLIEQQQGKYLLDQLYKQEIADKTVVSEAQIKDWYENTGEEIHARHILVQTEEEAREIRETLEGGAEFADLAKERSKDPSAATNGGDLSWFRWGTMVAPFQEAVFALTENEISQPVQTDFGWHVIQLLGRRQVDRQPFDQAVNRIRQQLTEQQTQLRLRDFLDQMKEKAEMRLKPEQLQLVQTTYRDTTGGPLPFMSNLDPNALNQKQQELPIAQYLDTALDVGRFITLAANIPPMNRPSFDDSAAVRELIFQMVYINILEREARRLRIDHTDDYKLAIQEFKETLMADKMRTDLMERPVVIPQADVQAYFDGHQEEFSTPPQVRLRETLVNSKEEADRIIERVRRGARFEDLCAETTQRPGMKAKKGDLGMFRRFMYPSMFDAAQKMETGQVGGPIYHATQNGGQWSVIQLITKQDAVTRSLGDVEGRIQDKLRNEARASVLQEWLEEMRAEVAVNVNEEVLAATIDKSRYPEKG